MKNKFTLLVALSAFFLFWAGKMSAQSTTAAGYYFYAKSGTFSYLSGGTTISSMVADDAVSSSIGIGFTFTYCGTDYTNIYASTNGFITFGSSPATYAYPGDVSYLGTSGGIGRAIMPLWDDLSGSGFGTASYSTTGTSPNRVFTIEFKNWQWDYAVSSATISYQIQLFETSNIIDVIYKDEGGTPSWDYTSGATIGLSGGTTSDYLSLNGSGTSPTASSSTFTNTIKTKPATGQIFEYAPLPQCSGTPSSLAPLGPAKKVCPGGTFTLTENTSTLTLGKTYQWQSKPTASGTFTNISGATSSSLSTSATANTDYRLLITCSASGITTTTSALTVNVLGKPNIDSTGLATYCSNRTFNLSSVLDTTYTYTWMNATSGASVASTRTFVPSASGRYTLKVSTAACTAGLVSTDTINVTIKPAPDAIINPSPSVTICDGETVNLLGSGSGNYQWFNGSSIIGGATATSYTTGLAGNYTLEITNPANGCKDTSDVTKVISTPAPTVYISPIDSISICTGLTTNLTSSVTGSGISYQWYSSAGILAGKTLPTLNTGNAQNYFLIVSAGSCKDTSNIVKVKLRPLPTATVTSSGTTTAICPMGSDLVLQAPGTAGYTYQWLLDGAPVAAATSRNYNVPTAGGYVVKVTDIFGCIKYSDTFKTFNTPSATPVVSPTDVVFCEGTEIILFANSDKYFVSYQWFEGSTSLSGDTTPTYNASLGGFYRLQITDSFNCKTLSNFANLTVMPAPALPVITQTGTRLSTTFYKTYQWYRNGKIIPGANARTYDVVFDGIYKVEVSNENGCMNTSEDLNVINLGIGTVSGAQKQVLVYPNPSAGIVKLEYKNPVNVVVKDLQGKTIYTANDVSEINTGNWADGIYFFTISDRDNNFLQTEKVAKNSH